MSENEKLERSRRRTKIILITITVLFIVLMLVVPLLSVIVNSLREGFTFYIESISTEYVRHSESAPHGCSRSFPSGANRFLQL